MMAQSAWKAGAAKVSITPSQPIWMAGYDARIKPSEGVLRDIFAEAVRRLVRPRFAWGRGGRGIAVNGGRVADASWPGPVVHDVPVLAGRGASGALGAGVLGHACHNTTLGDYRISGDYAGFAMEELEKQNPGAVALFVQGAGADANPPRRTVELAMRHGQTLAAAAVEVLHGKIRPRSPPPPQPPL